MEGRRVWRGREVMGRKPKGREGGERREENMKSLGGFVFGRVFLTFFLWRKRLFFQLCLNSCTIMNSLEMIQLLYLLCPATICVPPLCLAGGHSVWKDYVHAG